MGTSYHETGRSSWQQERPYQACTHAGGATTPRVNSSGVECQLSRSSRSGTGRRRLSRGLVSHRCVPSPGRTRLLRYVEVVVHGLGGSIVVRCTCCCSSANWSESRGATGLRNRLSAHCRRPRVAPRGRHPQESSHPPVCQPVRIARIWGTGSAHWATVWPRFTSASLRRNHKGAAARQPEWTAVVARNS